MKSGLIADGWMASEDLPQVLYGPITITSAYVWSAGYFSRSILFGNIWNVLKLYFPVMANSLFVR